MNETNGVNKFLVPVAVVLAGLFIGGAVIWSGNHPSTGGTATTGGTGQTAIDIKDVTIEGEPFIGQANAATTIAYWSDYQCPFCKQFDEATLPEIVKNYVATGKVKIVFKDFQFLGPDSGIAALYGRSVWALYPDLYASWRAALYNGQPTENSLSEADYTKWIDGVTGGIPGVDGAKVKADVAKNKAAYTAKIQADRTEGQNFGISATPSFIIGTQVIAGAYPYANFQRVLSGVVK